MTRLTLAALRWPLAALRRIAPPGRPIAGRRRGSPFADGGTRAREGDDHLRDVPDGAGCTEIWEYLSERASDDQDG